MELLPDGVITATGVVVNNAGMVKKVSFPREILALAAIGSAGVFFFFQSIVMVLFMVVLHVLPDLAYFRLLLVALVAGVVFACGPRGFPRLGQRLPARHPAPGRGGPHGVVLGLPDRLLLPDTIGGQAGTATT